METTRMSSKGQVIIPKSVRDRHGWKPGTEFVVDESGTGVILRPKNRFASRTIGELAGSLPYAGRPKTIEDMNAAVLREAKRRAKR